MIDIYARAFLTAAGHDQSRLPDTKPRERRRRRRLPEAHWWRAPPRRPDIDRS